MNKVIQEIAQSILTQSDEALLAANRQALESHDVPIVVLDADGMVRYLNKPACDVARVRHLDDVVGTHISQANFAWHVEGRSLLDRLAKGESTTYFELDGDSYACEAAHLFDNLGKEVGILEYIRPHGDWTFYAGIDEVTGLDDHSHFVADTRRLLDANPDEEYALVYWSVIRFQLICDVFSPMTGDMVLRNIAQTIRSYVGEEGTCGHFHEDSFVFCVPRSRISGAWFNRNSEVTLMSDTAMYTFNSVFGVCEIDDRTCSVDTMCERAARACSTVSEAHAIDGMCYAFFGKDLYERSLQDQMLVSELSYALEDQQIKVYFQPIYDVRTGRIASAEGLARWEHPQRGIISPGYFIHLFESNGMITELDKYLWNQVGAFLERRIAARSTVVPVSVNVSRVDFFATTLIDDLTEIVTTHQLPRELLRVEVTESAYTDEPTRILEVVNQVHESGFTVLLDDFGSGYSSLTSLKDMPIDIVKLDMSFLRDFDHDPRTKHIIEHIVAMSHDLGLKVVAEGVETAEQVEFLRSVGCNLAQGYHFARPLPKADFVKVLDEAPQQEQQ